MSTHTPSRKGIKTNANIISHFHHGVLGGIQTHVSGFAGQYDIQASLQGRIW